MSSTILEKGRMWGGWVGKGERLGRKDSTLHHRKKRKGCDAVFVSLVCVSVVVSISLWVRHLIGNGGGDSRAYP